MLSEVCGEKGGMSCIMNFPNLLRASFISAFSLYGHELKFCGLPSLVFGAWFIFSNNSVFLTAAVVRGEAMGDLVCHLLLAAVHHVVVEVPGFK